MKLIRLTTDTNDGRFDNDFNDDIIIKPDSKIALQSVSLNIDIEDLQIDGENDTMTFSITPTNTRTIQLKTKVYSQFNHHLLLNDMQLKLNQGLEYTDAQDATTFPNELGMQMKASIDANKKISIQATNCRYAYTTSNFGLTFNEIVATNINLTGNPLKLASSIANGAGDATSAHGFYSQKPFTTGCGVFRVKLSTWVADASGALGATSGFEFGLCDTPPDTWTLPNIPDTKKIFALKGNQPTDEYYFKNKANPANFVTTGITPDTVTGANADVLEISIQGNQIVGQIFRQGQANADAIFSEAYEVDSSHVPTPLYAYMVFHGSRANIEVVDIKFTPDAYLEPVTATDSIETFDESGEGLGARPLKARNQITTKALGLGSDSLATFLGYKNINHTQITKQANFEAPNLFAPDIENDCLIVLLENLPIESYDGFKKGRKSILASIPNPNHGDMVVYEPNNINYVELNNANKMSLRNIRATVLYQDYSPVTMQGFNVINVLID